MVGGNKVVATLRADGKVYPEGFISNLNLVNYKIRTEADMANKLSTLNVATTVVDLGKQLLQYARDSDLKGVRSMLLRGAPFTSDWLGMSALHFAAMNNQYEICEALLKGGINKDSKTKVDRTPLHLACYYGNDRIVELLLSKKCAINARDMLRMTPLHWAVEKRCKNIVHMLLEHNADVTVESKLGRTPIALAVLTEQADLLDELKAAKQMQANRKLKDEQEKETSEAVNSIIGSKVDGQEETPNTRQQMIIDGEDEFTSPHQYADIKMTDFANIKETGILDSTAINLLKSHGISMMQDDDDDTSKELLSTVLRNGRQLVLTEGGKLLLNEAKKTQNCFFKTTLSANSNNNNNNNTDTATSPNSKYGQQVITPIRNQITSMNKIRTSIISKPKDTNTTLGKNKNIRIISLHDFKKLYGNTNLKAIHKLPTLANTRTTRKSSTDIKSLERNIVMNVGQQSNRQVSTESSQDCNNINEKENPAMDIIEIEPTDSDSELNDIEQGVPAIFTTTPQQSQRVLPTRRMLDNNSVSLRPFVPAITKQQQASNVTCKTSNETSATLSTKQSPNIPSVIPLLSVPEICRQLYELRKQNEELRRKFDFVQKEKEEMRQRLERLEELLLVEKTEYDYAES